MEGMRMVSTSSTDIVIVNVNVVFPKYWDYCFL